MRIPLAWEYPYIVIFLVSNISNSINSKVPKTSFKCKIQAGIHLSLPSQEHPTLYHRELPLPKEHPAKLQQVNNRHMRKMSLNTITRCFTRCNYMQLQQVRRLN